MTKAKATTRKKKAPLMSRAASRVSGGAKEPKVRQVPQSKTKAASQAHMFLRTDDQWSKAYFDPNDLHCLERELFS
jgi:hypothetical protein